MSSLQILNAHPSLFWGIAFNFDASILDMKSTEDDPPRGVTTIFGREFDTTGILGSSESEGETTERGQREVHGEVHVDDLFWQALREGGPKLDAKPFGIVCLKTALPKHPKQRN